MWGAPCLILRNLNSIKGSQKHLITTANKEHSDCDDQAALRRGWVHFKCASVWVLSQIHQRGKTTKFCKRFSLIKRTFHFPFGFMRLFELRKLKLRFCFPISNFWVYVSSSMEPCGWVMWQSCTKALISKMLGFTLGVEPLSSTSP